MIEEYMLGVMLYAKANPAKCMYQKLQADPEGADEVRHPGRQVLKVAERQADALWVNLLAYALQNLHSACKHRQHATERLLLQ